MRCIISYGLLLYLVGVIGGASVEFSSPKSVLESPVPPNAVSLDIYHVNEANYTVVLLVFVLTGFLATDRPVEFTIYVSLVGICVRLS